MTRPSPPRPSRRSWHTSSRRPASRRRAAPWGLGPLLTLLALLLGGCTGTFETRPPVLLAVAFDDGSPALALLVDTFSALEPGQSRELTLLPWSRRALPAPGVALDVVDRAGARSALLVLARSDASGRSFLRGFTFDDVDLTSETGFTPLSRYELLLDGPEDDPGLLDRLGPKGPDDYCLTEVEASADGEFIAVFDDRERCGGDSGIKDVYVIDVDAGTVVSPTVDFGERASGAGLALAQGLERDTGFLFFLDAFATLFRWDPVEEERLELGPVDSGVDPEFRDLATVGSDTLVVLSREFYKLVDLSVADIAVLEVPTAIDARRVVDDPFDIVPALVLLGGGNTDDAFTRFSIHATLDNSDPDLEVGFAVISGVTAATLEPVDRFVYLVRDGEVLVFDLLTYLSAVQQGELPAVSAFFTRCADASNHCPVPELENPTAVTWTRAVALEVP